MSKYFQFPGWKNFYYDIVWSLLSAIIGSLCFSILANIKLANHRLVHLVPILIGWLFSLIFSFIPTIVFGGLLSYILHSEFYISTQKIYLLGGLAGGLSAIFIDMVVLRFTGIDLDVETFAYALIAVVIAIACGGWTAGKISSRKINNFFEEVK